MQAALNAGRAVSRETTTAKHRPDLPRSKLVLARRAIWAPRQ
jgi:hypothetical protein